MALLPPISNDTRRTLYVASAILLVGWSLSTQLTQRSFAAVDALPSTAVNAALKPQYTAEPAPSSAPHVTRDPFVVPATPTPEATAPPAVVTAPTAAPQRGGSSSAAGYVPDLGSGDGGAAGPVQPQMQVRGVVEQPGTNAYAIVDINGATRFVRIGDTIGDRTVKRIDLNGIVFDDGSTLGLAAR